MIFVRNTGKLCFATLREGGVELQVMLSLDRVGEDLLAAWKADVDLGDLVFVHGEVIASKRGELSVLADAWRITAKALRPLPVAHKPLSEETRVRQRYVDLIVRPEAREMVRTRAVVTRSIRETLHERGYLEVETPILQTVHGGAAARPFHTHLNAFDLDMSLRIATELYLKRCIVGGIEKVYEIGRTFRNEGVDSTHSPEFTMLEAYEAYGDYDTMAELTQALIRNAAAEAGVTVPVTSDRVEIDLSGPWRSVTIHDAVSAAVGEPVSRRDAGRRAAAACRRIRGGAQARLVGRADRAGTVREAGRAHAGAADLRQGLPGGRAPARATAPRRPAPGRGVGPHYRRRRDRAGLFRTGRSGRTAPAAWSSNRWPPRRAIRKRCNSTRTSCARSNTGCRRLVD